jgi:trimethylamine:corrinoid methyltransferase-like protein
MAEIYGRMDVGMYESQMAGRIATGLFRKMGHRAEYLAEPHTLKWFAKELYLPSPVIDRGTYDGWKRKGATTTAERAAERVRSVVAAYQPTSMPAELRAELRAIATRAGQRFGMTSLPPLRCYYAFFRIWSTWSRLRDLPG